MKWGGMIKMESYAGFGILSIIAIGAIWVVGAMPLWMKISLSVVLLPVIWFIVEFQEQR